MVSWWLSLRASTVTRFTAHAYCLLYWAFVLLLVIWGREENVMCTLFCRAWAGKYLDTMGTDLSPVLCSVLHSPLQQQHRTATCQAGCPCTAPRALAATRLHSVCFLREMGEEEAEQVTSLCRGHPSPGTVATPP